MEIAMINDSTIKVLGVLTALIIQIVSIGLGFYFIHKNHKNDKNEDNN